MTPSTVRLVNWLVFALLGASVVFWGLRLLGQPSRTPAPALVSAPEPVASIDTSAVARGLGAPVAVTGASANTAQAARFQLKGVAAVGQGGAALIAVDGQAAKPYALGAEVAPGLRLNALGKRHAELGEGATAIRLDLPAPSHSTPPAE